MKRDGLIGEDELPPSNATAERFKVTKGQVSAWGKQEDLLRQALQHGNVTSGRGKRKQHNEKCVPFNSRAARPHDVASGQEAAVRCC